MIDESPESNQYEIVYLAPAERDLRRLLDFLVGSGISLKRAQAIIRDIVKRIRILGNNPHLGFSIGNKYGIQTPYRGLICGKYIVVYEAIDAKDEETSRIEIRRIYHTREDYLTQILKQ